MEYVYAAMLLHSAENEISEAAAVPAYDELKGRVPEMYVSLKPGNESSVEIENKVKQAINEIIGPIARPTHVWVTSDLPKTRSGKILRSTMQAIADNKDWKIPATIDDPEILNEIVVGHQIQILNRVS